MNSQSWNLFRILYGFVFSFTFINASLLVLFSITANADLILTAPPRENPQQGQKIYGPIAEHLSIVLDERVSYEHPGGWARYATDMRNDKYDIVFDAPHFGAWRIKNLGHEPILRLPGQLGFVIVANLVDSRVNELRDLYGASICALASPNLGTMTVYNMLDNPVTVPQIYEVKGGFRGVFNGLKEKKCRAAVLRNHFYNKLADIDKKSIKIVVSSSLLPDQTITIAKHLRSKKMLMTKELMSVKGKQASAKLLGRFGKNAKTFKAAKKAEYKNLDELLSGVVWGW